MLRVPFRRAALLGAALLIAFAVRQFPIAALAQDQKGALADQIGTLTKKLDDELTRNRDALSKDESLKKALVALRDRIFAVDCDLDPINMVQCRVTQLAAIARTWNDFADNAVLNALTAEQKQALVTAVTEALDALSLLERQNPGIAVVNQAGRLTATLKGKGKSKADPKTPMLADAVKALREALKALPPGEPRINVVDAWYGDLFDIEYMVYRGGVRDPSVGARFCLATPAVRTFCQAKTECFNPTAAGDQGALKKAENGDVANVDGTHLCGFDPAPFADAQIKGLVILYQCLVASDEEWHSLSEITPHYLPKSMGADVNPKDWKYGGGYNARSAERPDDLIVAVLRTGAGTDIRCVRQVP